jgi:hypothetical protein
MQTKTFNELYEEAKSRPTPAQAFIAEVAALTHKSEQTIKMWLVGRQKPDELACSVIAKHFNVSPEALFPQN